MKRPPFPNCRNQVTQWKKALWKYYCMIPVHKGVICRASKYPHGSTNCAHSPLTKEKVHFHLLVRKGTQKTVKLASVGPFGVTTLLQIIFQTNDEEIAKFCIQILSQFNKSDISIKQSHVPILPLFVQLS